MTVGEILKQINVLDLIHKQRLIAVTEGDSVLQAADLLTSNNISSVPVFKAGNGQKLEACLGIVDFSDIANVIMDLRDAGYNEHNPKKMLWQRLSAMSVKDAIKFNASKYVQISVKENLLEAVERCAEFSFRRMLAVDEDDTIVGVVSPSEMIRQILEAIGENPEATLDKTIGELAVGTSPVVVIPKQELLERAFSLMSQHMVTAIGVIDSNTNTMQASVSVSDVGLLLQEKNSGLLKATVWKYITHKKEKEIDAVFPYFSVKPNSSLRKAMQRLLATQVHHLYIVDDKEVPLKVVGFAEICRGLLSFKVHASKRL